MKNIINGCITLLVLLVSTQLLHGSDKDMKTPKYILSNPYAEIISDNCYRVKINYFRMYEDKVDEGFEDSYFLQKLGPLNTSDFLNTESKTRSTYENFSVNMDLKSGSVLEFSDKKNIPFYVNDKKAVVQLDQDILEILDFITDNPGNNIYDKRKGTLILGFVFRMVFDTNEGQTVAEIESIYQDKQINDPDWIDAFLNSIELFENRPFCYIESMGIASPDFEGDVAVAEESNFDLAGLRGAAGVNFYISKYNELKNASLIGNASYNSGTNTMSLSGSGTERFVAINGGIRDTDKKDDGFHNDQCIYFRILL